MPISNEMRRLETKWRGGTGWPKRFEWIELRGIRGWQGERFEFRFPIMAVVGENGAGKSTLLQAAAAACRATDKKRGARIYNASWFFPDTPWESIQNAVIRYEFREGSDNKPGSVRKLTARWRGYNERPARTMRYIDLGRIQPVPERTGYSKLAKPNVMEVSATPFDSPTLERLSEIMGRKYEQARMSLTDTDKRRAVPVLGSGGLLYSGFHQGAGETAVAELLESEIPKYSLILIDEIESSLHPRAQRRLIRDLAAICRNQEAQILLTTHSPYVLDELPLGARACIMLTDTGREVVYGVTPDFAMSRLDDEPHYECDLYVEDARAATLLNEIVIAKRPELARRCQIIAFGAASVGRALGQMVAHDRFPRPTRVFLDGDESLSEGCIILPGEDAPERVVFGGLSKVGWGKVSQRIGRGFAETTDSCRAALLLADHHSWVEHAADRLLVGGDNLWQAMCAEWATTCLTDGAAGDMLESVEDALGGIRYSQPRKSHLPSIPTVEPAVAIPEPRPSSSAREQPDEPSLFDGQD